MKPPHIQQNRCNCSEINALACRTCMRLDSPHQEENAIEKFREEFDEAWYKTRNGHSCVGRISMCDWFENYLHLAEQKGYEKGQQDLLDEWNHDQKQLLDGFAHPKDCKMCKKHNLLKSKYGNV